MKTLFAAAVAVSLLTGTMTAAYADNDRGRHAERDRRDDHRGRDHDRGHDRGRDHRNDRRDDHRGDHRFDHRNNDRRHADNGRRYDNHHRYDNARRYDNRHDNWDRRDAYRAGYARGRHDDRRFDRGRYIQPRGYYRHSWRHGDHLPRSYYSTRYVVHDYHAYHLHQPPYGYHWVRVNNDVVLAAVASGLVVSVVNGLFY